MSYRSPKTLNQNRNNVPSSRSPIRTHGSNSSDQQTRAGSAAIFAVTTTSGIIFGFALEKSRVFEPHIIREQMLLENFTMLKMFLSACAAGMFSFSILSMCPDTKPKYESIVENTVEFHKLKSVIGVIVGGVLLGFGIYIAGACPGTVFAQIGAGVKDAIFTFEGGICGCFLYAATEPIILRLFKPNKPYKYYRLPEVLGLPYVIVVIPVAAFFGMIIFSLEVFKSWTSEVEKGDGLFVYAHAWPPFIAGILIGLLQIPLVISFDKTLGASKGFMTLASQLLRVITPLQRIMPMLLLYQSGMKNWWQIYYVGGAVLGAFLSAYASDSLGTVTGMGPMKSFFGGLIMIYGARVAGGCTSGHGLSGMALMMLLSFVAVPSIFGGAIFLAQFSNYMGIEL